MTSFSPDVNVWIALSDTEHAHCAIALNWLDHLPEDSALFFSRFTPMGLLRLLTNTAGMGEEVLTLGKAWKVYDRWLEDPRVDFYPEPGNVDAGFRRATRPFANSSSSFRSYAW